jgi:hypothetical protein
MYEMEYVANEDRLEEVFWRLSAHDTEVKRDLLESLQPLVTGSVSDVEKQAALLSAAIADRRPGVDKQGEAVTAFRTYVAGTSVNTDVQPKESHAAFLDGLCKEIPGVDQETANVFLKYLVELGGDLGLTSTDWRSWMPYLHVPLSSRVLNLMGADYLHVCKSRFERDFRDAYKSYASPSLNYEYGCLQQDIAYVADKVGLPSVTLDTLWFVGSNFCAPGRPGCLDCWLNNICMAKKGLSGKSWSSWR